MTTYVDTSTLVKRLIAEEGSERADEIWEGAAALVSAATIVVEARAALASATRGRRLSSAQHERAKAALDGLLEEVDVLAVDDEVIAAAADLAEAEALRGYDAIHLAAALDVGATYLTSSDAALSAASWRRGLIVLDPLDA